MIISDFVDLTQGTGPQHGYVIYSKGTDQQIVKIDGAVTTEIKDGRPDTKFKGSWAWPGGEPDGLLDDDA